MEETTEGVIPSQLEETPHNVTEKRRKNNVNEMSCASSLLSEATDSIREVPSIINAKESLMDEPPTQVQVSAESAEASQSKGHPSNLRLALHYVARNLISMAAPASTHQPDQDVSQHSSSTNSTPVSRERLDGSGSAGSASELSFVGGDESDHSGGGTSERAASGSANSPLHKQNEGDDGTSPSPRRQLEDGSSDPHPDHITTKNVNHAPSASSNAQDDEKSSSLKTQQPQPIPRAKRNCPEQLSTFLYQNHPDHHLLFNISSTEPSTQIRTLLDNQIINLPWTCPGINSTNSTDAPTAASIPTLKCLLDICYAMDAYLKLHPDNTAVVYCSNGKTRTGIAIAAYLKYSNGVSSALDGFRSFCSKTCQHLVSSEDIDDLIPPSLKTLFINFDSLVECGGAVREERLLLRAVTLQGLPVEDMPRVDIWDEEGLIYSSHGDVDVNVEEKGVDDDIRPKSSGSEEKKSTIWAEDDAFYRVNKRILGDFLLLARFGGEFAYDTEDPTKVILRYANNTEFLYPAALELPKTKVDVMRRYSDGVEEKDFLITFLFDDLEEDCEEDVPDSMFLHVLEGEEALHKGWSLISDTMCVHPMYIENNMMGDDLILLQNYYHGGVGVTYMPHPAPNLLLITLALQLSNGDIDIAVNGFLEGTMKTMWKEMSISNYFSIPIESELDNDLVLGRDIPQCLSAVKEAGESHDDDSSLSLVKSKSLSKSYDIPLIIDEDLDLEERSNSSIHDDRNSYLCILDEIDFTQSPEEHNNGLDMVLYDTSTTEQLYQPSTRPISGDVSAYLEASNYGASGDTVISHDAAEKKHGILGFSDRAWKQRLRNESLENVFISSSTFIGGKRKRYSDSSADENRQMKKVHDRNTSIPSEVKNSETVNAVKITDVRLGYGIAVDVLMQLSHADVNEEDLTALLQVEARESEQYASSGGNFKKSNSAYGNETPILNSNINKQEKQQSKAPPSDAEKTGAGEMGGVAAMAALKKQQKQHDASSHTNKPASGGLGGIAAMAAAAALKKQESQDNSQSTDTDKPASGGLGGIAAMAAAAALKKQQKQDDASSHTDKPASGGLGGIAAMAAAAALKKQEKQDDASSHTDKPESGGLGGIAAMAAAAALKKQQTHGNAPCSETEKPASGGLGGIAGMAAAAAVLKKQEDASFTETSKPSAVGMGGIAAMAAAAAALKKQQNQEDAPPYKTEKSGAGGMGGFGAMTSSEACYGSGLVSCKNPTAVSAGATITPYDLDILLRAVPLTSLCHETSTLNVTFDSAGTQLFSFQVRSNEGSNSWGQIRFADNLSTVDFASLDVFSSKSLDIMEMNDFATKKQYIPIILGGKKCGQGRIVAKNSQFYTLQIPVKALQDGKIFINNSFVGGGGADSSGARNFESNQQSLSTDMNTSSVAGVKLDNSSNETSAAKNEAHSNDKETGPQTDAKPKIFQQECANPDSKQSNSENGTKPEDVPFKDDPEYTKYFKMLKMGLPMGAVKNALQRDGKDPAIMDLDPNKSIKSQMKSGEKEEDTGPALKDDPEYTKYFKMLKMGLPMGAVKNALQRDGKDPAIMDLDPNKSIKSQTKKKRSTVKKEKKPKVRRKKIYWNAIDKSKVQKDSLWGKIRGLVGMEKLKIDTSEFESLFTETLDPSQKKKKKAGSEKDASKPKKSVQVIEGKRGMNGGIILARLKMDFKELAQIVNHM